MRATTHKVLPRRRCNVEVVKHHGSIARVGHGSATNCRLAVGVGRLHRHHQRSRHVSVVEELAVKVDASDNQRRLHSLARLVKEHNKHTHTCPHDYGEAREHPCQQVPINVFTSSVGKRESIRVWVHTLSISSRAVNSLLLYSRFCNCDLVLQGVHRVLVLGGVAQMHNTHAFGLLHNPLLTGWYSR